MLIYPARRSEPFALDESPNFNSKAWPPKVTSKTALHSDLTSSGYSPLSLDHTHPSSHNDLYNTGLTQRQSKLHRTQKDTQEHLSTKLSPENTWPVPCRETLWSPQPEIFFVSAIYSLDGRGGQLRVLSPSNTPHYFPLQPIGFSPFLSSQSLGFQVSGGPPKAKVWRGPSRFQALCVRLSRQSREIKENVTKHAETNLDAATPFVSFQRAGALLGGLVDK